MPQETPLAPKAIGGQHSRADQPDARDIEHLGRFAETGNELEDRISLESRLAQPFENHRIDKEKQENSCTCKNSQSLCQRKQRREHREPNIIAPMVDKGEPLLNSAPPALHFRRHRGGCLFRPGNNRTQLRSVFPALSRHSWLAGFPVAIARMADITFLALSKL
ncbi:MAG: hypothetical protein R3D29_10840 [Nitratireductor sp.]